MVIGLGRSVHAVVRNDITAHLRISAWTNDPGNRPWLRKMDQISEGLLQQFDRSRPLGEMYQSLPRALRWLLTYHVFRQQREVARHGS